MSISTQKSGRFLIKTSVFIMLLIGAGAVRAEYWIDAPPIAPVGCGYVYARGFSSNSGCHHRYKHYSHKYKYTKHYYPRVNYRVTEYFYVPPVVCQGNCAPPPMAVGCSSCSTCGGGCGVERVRGDGSYYSDVTMGGYPSYPYVNFSYDSDLRTGDDDTGEVSYTY